MDSVSLHKIDLGYKCSYCHIWNKYMLCILKCLICRKDIQKSCLCLGYRSVGQSFYQYFFTKLVVDKSSLFFMVTKFRNDLWHATRLGTIWLPFLSFHYTILRWKSTHQIIKCAWKDSKLLCRQNCYFSVCINER